MPEFRTCRAYSNFADSVAHERRFTLSPELEEFLQTLLATSEQRTKTIPFGKLLYRAQKGCSVWEAVDAEDGYTPSIECPWPPDRMKPRKGQATEGRANPKGIAYLYTATDQATAIAEMRPYVGSLVSVAELYTARDLRVLNCVSDDRDRKIYLGEQSPDTRERLVWQDIDRAFARPVSREDDSICEYAPTQILAEHVRQHGFAGIEFRSSLGPGRNLVLFDLDSVRVGDCCLVRIGRVKVDFEIVEVPEMSTVQKT